MSSIPKGILHNPVAQIREEDEGNHTDKPQRAVYATKDIAPGEVVLRDVPLLTVLHPQL